MQMSRELITKMRNDGCFINLSASSPSTSETVTFFPAALGGVWGRVKQ